MSKVYQNTFKNSFTKKKKLKLKQGYDLNDLENVYSKNSFILLVYINKCKLIKI